MAPDVRRAPLRWMIVTGVMILFALAGIGSAAYTVTIAQKSNRQEAEIVALKARNKAADDLKAAIAKGAKARQRSECRARISATRQVNAIIAGLRATYLELAAEKTTPELSATLRQRAKALPVYPTPVCDDGT